MVPGIYTCFNGHYYAGDATACNKTCPICSQIANLQRELAAERAIGEAFDACQRELAETKRELEEACTAINDAEKAIELCPALKDWGANNSPEHHASRVNNLCRMYDNCVDALSSICNQRDAAEERLRQIRQDVAELKVTFSPGPLFDAGVAEARKLILRSLDRIMASPVSSGAEGERSGDK